MIGTLTFLAMLTGSVTALSASKSMNAMCSVAASGNCPALNLGDKVLAVDTKNDYHLGMVSGMINNGSGVAVNFASWTPTADWWKPGYMGALPLVPVSKPTIGLLVVAKKTADTYQQGTIAAPGASPTEWIVRFNDGVTTNLDLSEIIQVCTPSGNPALSNCTSAPVGSCDALVPGNKVLVAEAVPMKYIGCYQDDVGYRDLDYVVCESGLMESKKNDGMCGVGSDTNEKCALWCASFKYFGTQNSNQCFCGDTYGSQGKADEGDCNVACGGNSKETCGASGRNSIYSTAVTTWSSAQVSRRLQTSARISFSHTHCCPFLTGSPSASQVLGLTSSNALYVSGDNVPFSTIYAGYVAEHKGLVKDVAPDADAVALGMTVLAKQSGTTFYSMGRVVRVDGGSTVSVLFEQGFNNVVKGIAVSDMRLLCYAFA